MNEMFSACALRAVARSRERAKGGAVVWDVEQQKCHSMSWAGLVDALVGCEFFFPLSFLSLWSPPINYGTKKAHKIDSLVCFQRMPNQ